MKDIVNFEKAIKEGKRGITDCRNRVVADMFYGAETMEKAGSGLSDACRSSDENKNQIEFGPIDNNTAFEIKIQRRPEVVDDVTETAYHSNFGRYVTNLLEVVKLPNIIWHAGTKVKKPREVLQNVNPNWVPPFIIHSGRLFSFHNLSIPINPLYSQINVEDIVNMNVIEFTKKYGEQRFVWMLKENFYRHLDAQGLWIDKARMRAYFPRTEEGNRRIKYQARVRRATRTVVKKKDRYWEHKSFWFGFERFENVWALVMVPGYVFTTNGKSDLLEGKVVNRLSTIRKSRDYNNVVHNDLVFWSWILSGGRQGTFALNLYPENVAADTIFLNQIQDDNESEILLKSNLSTTVVENIEPDTISEDRQFEKQREEKLVQLEFEFSDAISQLEEVDNAYSN